MIESFLFLVQTVTVVNKRTHSEPVLPIFGDCDGPVALKRSADAARWPILFLRFAQSLRAGSTACGIDFFFLFSRHLFLSAGASETWPGYSQSSRVAGLESENGAQRPGLLQTLVKEFLQHRRFF